MVVAVLTHSDLAPHGIGVALMALVYAGGHISGAHYNPRGVDSCLGSSRPPGQQLRKWIWLYLVAQFAGVALAGLAFRFIEPEDAADLDIPRKTCGCPVREGAAGGTVRRTGRVGRTGRARRAGSVIRLEQ